MSGSVHSAGAGSRFRLPLVFLFVVIGSYFVAGNCLAGSEMDIVESERTAKAIKLNAAAAGIVLTWGVLNWDYFKQSPETTREEWFGKNTDSGGADKLGHMYTAYALTHLWDHLYRKIGYPEDDAVRLAALSSLGVTGLIEIGDSFSDFGFSYEDMAMNVAGSALGYLFLKNDDLSKKIDYRVEYKPNLGSNYEYDFTTDYQHLKFLFAVKADGFEAIKNPYLKYLEFHLGYYTRGYDDWPAGKIDDRERILYTGVGLNVGKLISSIWKTRTFDYLQVPYTYVPLENDLND